MKDVKWMKKTNRPIVLVGIILAMFMAAVEGTIVSTAMPKIVAELGGFSIFSWVFGSYMLMQVISIPLFGKFADLFGRKRVFSIGVIIFLAGSTISGFANSMTMLIAGRFFQGLGAGAVQPIATTIVGDIYTKEERASIQGYLSSIWGISAILGPVLGGIFVDYLRWAWVFWMNIPVGLIAMILVFVFLREEVEKRPHSIDYLGSGLLLISISTLMLVLIQGGATWAWTSREIIFFSCLFFISFLLFIIQEKRAKEPVIDFAIWKHKLILFANIASFTAGGLLLAVSSYLPTYVQGVMGQSAMAAGFTLTVISLGWPLSSTIAGKLMLIIGFRRTAIIGGMFLIFGSLFYLTLSFVHSPIWAGIGSFFIGGGMGFSTTTFIVAIQSTVHWRERGAATAANMFMRILGGAVIVALLGGILNSRLSDYLAKYADQLSLPQNMDVINYLLEESTRQKMISEQEIAILQNGLEHSLMAVFWGIFIFAIISFLFILCIPKKESGEIK